MNKLFQLLSLLTLHGNSLEVGIGRAGAIEEFVTTWHKTHSVGGWVEALESGCWHIDGDSLRLSWLELNTGKTAKRFLWTLGIIEATHIELNHFGTCSCACISDRNGERATTLVVFCLA